MCQGTEKGELLLIGAGTFLAVLQDSPMDGGRVSCLAPLQAGFLAASPEAVFRYYAFHGDEAPGTPAARMFTLAHTWRIDGVPPTVRERGGKQWEGGLSVAHDACVAVQWQCGCGYGVV